MSNGQGAAYWAAAGALLGLGGILIFSAGLPLVVVGGILLIYGLARALRLDLVWVGGVAGGLLPAGVLGVQYAAAAGQPGTEFPPGYLALAGSLAVIGLGAGLWGLLPTRRARR